MLRYFIFLHFFILALFADNLTLSINNQTSISNNFEIKYLKDTTKLLKLEDIQKKDFKKTSKNGFSLGYAKQNLWIKVDLLNKSDEKNFILTLNEIFYEKANLYYKKDGKWLKKANSLFKLIEKREIKYNKLSFRFELPKNAKQTIYLELSGQYSYYGKVLIFKESSFVLNKFFDINSLYLFICGITFVILIFSIGSAISLKESIYYYYTGYTFFNLIYLLNVSGILVYLNLQKYIYVFHMSVAFFYGFLILFSLEFLGIKQYLEKYYLFLKSIAFFYFLIGLAFFFDYRPWNQILSGISILTTIIFLALSIYIYFKGHKRSKYYCFVLTLYLIFVISFLLMLTNTVEYNNFTRYSFTIINAVENILFSLIIINRYNEIRDDQERILKQRVKQSTKELIFNNKKLTEILEERELLLKEILHRVKNNFHMILGVLWFESKKHKDRNIFSELVNRIKSMAKIHEYLLHSSQNLTNIDAKEYLKELIESITSAYTDKRIDISILIENIQIEFDEAISLSVIINEVLNNSIKHCYSKDDILIYLTLQEKDNKIILKIKDNGDGFDMQNVNLGLGLKLIKDFSKKLENSTSTFISSKGTLYSLSFNRKAKNGILDL